MRGNRPSPILCAVILATSILVALGARAQGLLVEPDYPQRGVPATIQVFGGDGPMPAATVEVTYRPNSEASFSETLPPTGADGTVVWQPAAFGLVLLETNLPEGPAEFQVAVREGRFPPAGILTMTVAATLLFGGVIVGLVLLLRD